MTIGTLCRFLRNVDVPQVGSLIVTNDGDVKYHVAMGEQYGQDSRDSASQYVCGVEYTGTGSIISFEQKPSSGDVNTYILKVAGNVLSPKPVNW